MLKEKFYFEKQEAIMLTVDLGSNLQGYAQAFLKLWNNAREYPDMIYKITNNRHDNTVCVFYNPAYAENVREFCTGIVYYYDEDKEDFVYVGKVTNEAKVIIGIPYYEYESDLDVDDPAWEDDIDQAVSEWLGVREE